MKRAAAICPHAAWRFPRRGRARACLGLTLVELMLAISILSLVGVCIVMMIKGTSDGTAGQNDGRRHLVRMQSLEAHVASTVRPCRAILAAGNGHLVLWTGDGRTPVTGDNLAVNVSEILLLELGADRKLRLYATVFPASYSAAQITSADSQYATSANWYNAAMALKSNPLFAPTVLATNITAFNVTLDAGTATAARAATLWITIDDGAVSRTVIIPAALRQPTAPQ